MFVGQILLDRLIRLFSKAWFRKTPIANILKIFVWIVGTNQNK